VTVAPDGSHIATTTQFAQEDLSVFGPDGSRLQQITNDRARNRWPAFSPDGQQIVFSSNRGPSGIYDVWMVNLDGSGLRQLTDGLSISYLAWSPKGDRIVGSDARTYNAWLIDPRRPMTEQRGERLPSPPADMRQFYPRGWSPDGRRLAGPVGNSGIATYDLDSKTYTRELDNYPGIATAVRWLDSRRILFISQRRVMLLDTATHQVREVLSAAPDNITDFATTRDGRELFITRGTSEADIWMATIK
jgi:Tol biopolymer transport system component